MKSLLLAAALVAGATVAASAADLRMPVKAPLLSAAPAASWTGLYAGVNVGGVWSNASTSLVANPVFFAGAAPLINGDGSVGLNNSGFTGGGQLGYNWQTGQFVFGVEGDIGYTGINKSGAASRATAPGLPAGYALSESITSNWLSTLRGRAGITSGSWLFYATGGLAIANVNFTQSIFVPNCPCGLTGSSNTTRAGWTVGAGTEWAGWISNWTVKAEYLYVDLGKQNFADNLGAFGFPAASFTHQSKLTENLVRVGLNYKLPAFH
jgi:outer membrane immunogenic protein